jgi:prevent-host-death family protein
MSETSVGAYEAKTHLAQLLDRCAQGERFVITRHGKPVAVLAPVDEAAHSDPLDAVAELRSFRAGRTLGAVVVGELTEPAE